jgi:hypothetical protein
MKKYKSFIMTGVAALSLNFGVSAAGYEESNHEEVLEKTNQLDVLEIQELTRVLEEAAKKIAAEFEASDLNDHDEALSVNNSNENTEDSEEEETELQVSSELQTSSDNS